MTVEEMKDWTMQAFDEMAYAEWSFVGRLLNLAEMLGTDAKGAVDELEINYEIKEIAEYLLKRTKFDERE